MNSNASAPANDNNTSKRETTPTFLKELWNRIIQTCIRIYRRSPLYPKWGRQLAKILHSLNRMNTTLFVHDCGQFKLNIDLSQIIDNHIYYNGCFEPDAVTTMNQLVEKGATVVDIGANIGCHTMHLANCVGSEGRVIAFEPAPWARERLLANLGLNRFQQVAVEVFGLSDHEGVVETAIQSSYRLDGTKDKTKLLVSFLRFDDYFDQSQSKRLDFIKLDTDGMEHRILAGSEATLREFRPNLLFEVAPDGLVRNGSSASALLDWLRRLDYEFFQEGNLKPYGDELEALVPKISHGTSLNMVAIPKERTSALR